MWESSTRNKSRMRRKCLCLSNLHLTVVLIVRKTNSREFDEETFVADALRLAVKLRHGLENLPTPPAPSGGGKNITKTNTTCATNIVGASIPGSNKKRKGLHQDTGTRRLCGCMRVCAPAKFKVRVQVCPCLRVCLRCVDTLCMCL